MLDFQLRDKHDWHTILRKATEQQLTGVPMIWDKQNIPRMYQEKEVIQLGRTYLKVNFAEYNKEQLAAIKEQAQKMFDERTKEASNIYPFEIDEVINDFLRLIQIECTIDENTTYSHPKSLKKFNENRSQINQKTVEFDKEIERLSTEIDSLLKENNIDQNNSEELKRFANENGEVLKLHNELTNKIKQLLKSNQPEYLNGFTKEEHQELEHEQYELWNKYLDYGNYPTYYKDKLFMPLANLRNILNIIDELTQKQTIPNKQPETLHQIIKHDKSDEIIEVIKSYSTRLKGRDYRVLFDVLLEKGLIIDDKKQFHSLCKKEIDSYDTGYTTMANFNHYEYTQKHKDLKEQFNEKLKQLESSKFQ